MSGPTPEHRAFVEAGIGIVMSVVMADGVYNESEMQLFVKAQHQYDLFRDVPPDAFNAMLGRVRARMQAEPWKALVTEWANAVPPEHSRKIFELAIQFVTADKSVGGQEPEVLRQLADGLGIPDAEARRMFAERVL
jgi:uncharacterized tellurite resistance protein B-like protein